LLKSDNNFLRNSHNSEHTRMWSFVPRHTACKMQSSEGVKDNCCGLSMPRTQIACVQSVRISQPDFVSPSHCSHVYNYGLIG